MTSSERRIEREVRVQLGPRCPAKATDEQCQRDLGHEGCHFAFFGGGERGFATSMQIHWVDKGQRMKALYPKQRKAASR